MAQSKPRIGTRDSADLGQCEVQGVAVPEYLLVAAVRRAAQLTVPTTTRYQLAIIAAIRDGALHTVDDVREWRPDPNVSLVLPGVPAKATRRKAELTFLEWIATQRDAKCVLLPGNDPIYDYADEIGMPSSYVALAWMVFTRDSRRAADKRQRDWRAHFRDTVRRGWQKLWFVDGENNFQLTTAGKMAWKAHMTDGTGKPWV